MFWTKSRSHRLSNAAKLMNALAEALENADYALSNVDESRETQKLSRQLVIAKKACSDLSDEFKENAEEYQGSLRTFRDSSKAN